jgi:hypothetical protein
VSKGRAYRLSQRLFAYLVCASAFSFARSPDSTIASPDVAQQVTAECVGISLQQINTDKVVFALKVTVDAGQDLKLDEVTLVNLHLNGLPVFATPLQVPIHLIKGQKVALPQPILMTIYLHDFTSTKPLSQALLEGFATLDGELYASVHLSAIAKIALGTFQAVVPMKLQQKVPVAIPGGALSKTAALATLEAADVALKHLLAGVSATQGIWPGLRHDVLEQYAPVALAVAVTYAVKDTKGMEVPLTWTGVAFRLSPKQIVLPYEALEPWSFDPDISTALQSGAYTLEPDTFRLSAWPSGEAAPTSLTTDGGLQLGKQLHSAPPTLQATTQVMIPTHSRLPQKGTLDVRASSKNITFLTATEALPAVASAKIASDPLPARWDTVALLRFPRLGSGTLTPEVILTSAYLDHGRIRLEVSVDSTVFGSPIIASNGIIGMVQDESSGIPLNGVTESIKSSK